MTCIPSMSRPKNIGDTCPALQLLHALGKAEHLDAPSVGEPLDAAEMASGLSVRLSNRAIVRGSLLKQ